MQHATHLLAFTALAFAAVAQSPPSTDELVTPRRWALVVGASDYEHLGRLRYAAADARDFADALVEQMGFTDQTVRLLTDDTDDPRLTPTAGHLIGELEALLADPLRNRSDLFVFYFCGHGTGRETGDYLLPTDARHESAERVGLPVREVVDRLAKAGMRNVLVIVDACRQGTENEFGRELWRLADAARLSVVLGCEPGEQSYEDRFFGHGVFTHFLLQAVEDPELRDDASGALWASSVMTHVAERVRAHTEDREAPQRPMSWTDPTRDVLLDVVVPEGPDRIPEFARSAERLSTDSRIDALGAYGWSLLGDGRFEETVEVLKTAAELGPLPPELAQALGASFLMLGRSVEAGRVFAELRTREPDSLPALAATVCDSSGAVSGAERARAATALWETGAGVPFGLLARMIEAQLSGGSTGRALEIARAALPVAPEDSRDSHFLAAVVASLEQRSADAVGHLERAAERPGEIPDDRTLARERVAILAGAAAYQEMMAALDACVARWPDDGEWYAQRAWLKRAVATDARGRRAALSDVGAALARSLGPDDLLLAVRTAGANVGELADSVAARAADHPLSWKAQIARVFATQPADLRDQVAAAARLAARPALVYATMARLTLDGTAEQIDGLRADPSTSAEVVAAVDRQFDELVRSLFERIAPMASEFGPDPDAWAVLAELAQRTLAYEAFHRLFEQHLGDFVDTGGLPERLVRVHGESCLNTGRIERFRAGGRSLLSGGAERDARRWLEAAFVATTGDHSAASELLGDSEEPRAPRYAELGAPLRALLRARAGDAEGALALLEERSPRGMLGRSIAGLARHAAGDVDGARATMAELQDLNPENAFFAYAALFEALNDDPRRFAHLAALYQPGNPLFREASYVPGGGIEAFAGALELRVEASTGPVDASGATLTLTVLGSGRVVGALELAGGDALVVRGTTDEFGNFDGELVGDSGAHRLLAKLAPVQVHDELEELGRSGQVVQIWAAGNIQFAWICRPVR